MSKTTTVRARVEPKAKEKAERYFKGLGLSTSQAINLFLKQVILFKGLPFEVRIPNKETIKAIRDADEKRNLTTYDDLDEFRKSLGL